MRHSSTRTGKIAPAEPATATAPPRGATPSSPGEWLTADDVGTLLRVSPATLRSWRGSGKGPPFHRLTGKKLLYERGEVEAWLAERIVRPRGDNVETSQRSSGRSAVLVPVGRLTPVAASIGDAATNSPSISP